MKSSEQQKYYAEVWEKRSLLIDRDERRRMTEICAGIKYWRKKFPQKKSLKILDFGCGTGWLGQFLSDQGEVHAADFEHMTIQKASKSFPHIKFHLLTDDKPLYGLPANSFDIIVATEVIEHVSDKVTFLQNIYQMLSSKGLVILTTPRGEKFPIWTTWVKGVHQPVEEWLTTPELDQLVTQSGFQVLFHKWIFYTRISNSLSDRLLTSPILQWLKLIPALWQWLTDRWGIYQFIMGIKKG